MVETPTEAEINEESSAEPEIHYARESQHDMNRREIQYGHDEEIVVYPNDMVETHEPEHDEEEFVVHSASQDAISAGQDNDIVVAPCCGNDDEIIIAPDMNDKAQEVMKDNLELMKEVVTKIRADPEFAKSIYRDCPRLQYLLDQHPDLRPIFEDPELIAINFEKVYRDAGGVLPGDEPKEPPKLNFFYRILVCIVTSRAFIFVKIALRIKRIVFFFLNPNGGFQIIKNLVKGLICGMLHPGEDIDKLVSGVDQQADIARKALESAAKRLENPKIQAKLEALLDEPEKLCEAIENDKVLRSLRDMNSLCAALMSSSEMMKVLVDPSNLRALGECPSLIAQDFADPGGWTIPDVELSGGGGGGGGNIGGWTPPAGAAAAAASGARSGGGGGGQEPQRSFLRDASAGVRSYAFNILGGNIVSDAWGLVKGNEKVQVGEMTLESLAVGLTQKMENMVESINVDSVIQYENNQGQNQAYFLQYETSGMQQQGAMQSREIGDARRDAPEDVQDPLDPSRLQNVPESNDVPSDEPKAESRFGWIGELGASIVDNAKQNISGAIFGQAGNFVYAVASARPSSKVADPALDENNQNATRAVGEGGDQEGDGEPQPDEKKGWKLARLGSTYLSSAQNVAATVFVGQDFADSLEKRQEERSKQRALKARSAPKSAPDGENGDGDFTTKLKRRLAFGRRSRIPPPISEQTSYP